MVPSMRPVRWRLPVNWSISLTRCGFVSAPTGIPEAESRSTYSGKQVLRHQMSGFRRKTYPLIEAADDALWRAFQGHALTQAVVPKTDSSAGLQSRIRDHALRIGFDAIGFCRADLAPEARERLRSFLKAGCHGDMGWLADRTEQRSQPKSLWPDVRSVIVVGMSYAPAHDP